MPTRKPVNNTQDLRTSNLTSSVFLGGTHRPWMTAGNGATDNIVNQIEGLRRANAHGVRVSSNPVAINKSASRFLLAPTSDSSSIDPAETSELDLGQGTVESGESGEREEQVTPFPLVSGNNVRTLATSMPEGDESTQTTISPHVSTMTNLTEIFSAQPVTTESVHLVHEVSQSTIHPPQTNSIAVPQTSPAPLHPEIEASTTHAESAVSTTSALQSTPQRPDSVSYTRVQPQTEPSYEGAAHTVVHTSDRSSFSTNGQVHTVTGGRSQASSAYTLQPMIQGYRSGLTTSGSADMSPGNQTPIQQPPEPAMTGAASAFLPLLDQRLAFLRSQIGPFNFVSEGRITCLRNACQSEDLYFLLLHQIYCLWSLKREWLWSKLGFGPDQEDGFQRLELLMVSNLAMPFELLGFFSAFINSSDILESSPAVKPWVDTIRVFLTGFPSRWNKLGQVCILRGSPPCAWEICNYLKFGRSPVLQQACFNSLCRQLFPFGSAVYTEELTKIFVQDQKMFLSRLEQGTLQRLPYPDNIKIFQRHCNFIKERYGQVPTSATNMTSPSNLPPGAFPNNHRNNSAHMLASHNPYQLYQHNGPPSSPITALPSAPSMVTNDPVQPRGRGMNHQRIYTGTGPPQSRAHQVMDSRGVRSVHHTNGNGSDRYQNPNQLGVTNDRPVRTIIAVGPSTNNVSAGAQPSNNRQASKSLPLLPALNFRLPILANPNADNEALHQVHLRSSGVSCQDLSEDSSYRRYCYLQSFLLTPQTHTTDSSFSSWTFEIPSSLAVRLVKDVLPAADDVFGQITRDLDNDKFLTSVKCVQLSSEKESLEESVWSSAPTHWPENGFFSLNDTFIELRRKIHYRKDLPADVTSITQTGENKLSFSYIPDPKEVGMKFLIALEVVIVSDHQAALNAPTRIDSRISLDTIKARLKPNGNDDDDLMMLDPYMSIDLVDPFTSQICQIPVRGASCLHRECFDLESFLQSRSSRDKNGVISPDEWLCPICKRDARPTSLVIDEFLLEVKGQLVEKGKTDVRAILVKEDGSWEPKTETVPVKDVPTQAQVSANTPVANISDQNKLEDKSRTDTRSHSTTPLVIDLMDD